ncbi:hypothetical protein QVZ41_14385 [Wenyingzhuangia sp. chi5]|uniref:Uncharacterized protein n=1 Tax=Wenyingzhuangia gilva TaxID=3057677 RepID=A0ABT8VVN6_9FLAO|nr:hypothetical protein [Wenyingzhuangia sp. chi5]MDO3696037.1 hypothetical protein [Wenyingzhuangia sp. chi5]
MIPIKGKIEVKDFEKIKNDTTTPAKLHAGFVLTSKFCVYLLSRQILLIWLCEIKETKPNKKLRLSCVFENLGDFLPAQSLAKTVAQNKIVAAFFIKIFL